jgi:hypothetical protein
MDERKNRGRDDLMGKVERDAEIRRERDVRNALGSVGDEESRAAESVLSPEERQSGRSRSDRSNRAREQVVDMGTDLDDMGTDLNEER